MSKRDPLLTDKELEIEAEADMEAALDPRYRGVRVFASKAEERRFKAHQDNSPRRDW